MAGLLIYKNTGGILHADSDAVWVSYLYIWSIFAVVVLLIKSDSVILWSLLSGIFGLCFGFLCAVPYFVTGGAGGGGAG